MVPLPRLSGQWLSVAVKVGVPIVSVLDVAYLVQAAIAEQVQSICEQSCALLSSTAAQHRLTKHY